MTHPKRFFCSCFGDVPENDQNEKQNIVKIKKKRGASSTVGTCGLADQCWFINRRLWVRVPLRSMFWVLE